MVQVPEEVSSSLCHKLVFFSVTSGPSGCMKELWNVHICAELLAGKALCGEQRLEHSSCEPEGQVEQSILGDQYIESTISMCLAGYMLTVTDCTPSLSCHRIFLSRFLDSVEQLVFWGYFSFRNLEKG